MATLLIKNIGEFFTGDIAKPQAAVKSLGYAGFNAGRILGDELNPNNETDPAVRREIEAQDETT